MRIKILQTFNGNVNGESWKFTAGEERDVPDVPALEFIRGHYAAQIVAVKIQHKPVETGRKAHIK